MDRKLEYGRTASWISSASRPILLKLTIVMLCLIPLSTFVLARIGERCGWFDYSAFSIRFVGVGGSSTSWSIGVSDGQLLIGRSTWGGNEILRQRKFPRLEVTGFRFGKNTSKLLTLGLGERSIDAQPFWGIERRTLEMKIRGSSGGPTSLTGRMYFVSDWYLLIPCVSGVVMVTAAGRYRMRKSVRVERMDEEIKGARNALSEPSRCSALVRTNQRGQQIKGVRSL